MEWVYANLRAKKIPPYKAVFTFEADAAPLSPHWVEAISREWDQAKAFVMGAYLTAPGPHINGNMLVSTDFGFLHWLTRKVVGVNPNAGWDYVLAPEFKKWGWHPSAIMRSYWNTKTLDRTNFDACISQGVVFLHGVKDGSLIQHCRDKYLSSAH